MDDLTIKKVNDVMCRTLNDLIRIADEGNYDRDSFMESVADMFGTMVSVSTFENYKLTEVIEYYEE